MKSKIKTKVVPSAFIVLGALLVGFNIYKALFSGTELERTSLKVSGEEITKQVELTPDMNPVRALIRAKYEITWHHSDIRRDPTGRDISAEVSMLDAAGKTVWDDSVDYYRNDEQADGRKRTPDTTKPLRTFDVPRAGLYTFTSNVHAYRGSIEEVELILKRNVAKMSVPSVILGAVLVLAGLVMGSADHIKHWLAKNGIRRPKST